jgi:hypothetical protein
MAELITLDSVIKNYIIEKGDSSKHGYQRFLQIAITGLKDMDYDVSGTPKYLECTPSDQATIPIPSDMINLIGVYAVDGSGSWTPFAKDIDMAMSVQRECGTPTQAQGKVPFNANSIQGIALGSSAGGYVSEAYTNHFRNGENTGGYYNQPGGNVFLFRENPEMHAIELSSNATSVVILEYLPSHQKVNGQHLVHPFLLEPLLAWLRYATIRSKRNTTNEALTLKREYYNVKRLAQLRFNAFTKADFVNAFRSHYKSSYKF